MIRWVMKKGRTRTDVHSQADAVSQRQSSRASALRAMAAVQLASQLLLWVTFQGYDRAVQTVWQAALMLALPLLILYLVWKKGVRAQETRAAGYMSLPLLVCLLTDAAQMLYALCGFVDWYIPEYPYAVGAISAATVCWLAVMLGRRNGTAYGISAAKPLLVVSFLLATVFLSDSNRADRLWPLLGQGIGHTAGAAR